MHQPWWTQNRAPAHRKQPRAPSRSQLTCLTELLSSALTMDRLVESKLLDFCVRQQKGFDALAWSVPPGREKDRLSLVAMLLASAPWYGHRQSLLQLARQLNSQAYFDTPALVHALDFDCSRFVHMLRARLEHEVQS